MPSAEQNFSGIGSEVPGDQAKERRFPTSRCPEKHMVIALFESHRELFESKGRVSMLKTDLFEADVEHRVILDRTRIVE